MLRSCAFNRKRVQKRRGCELVKEMEVVKAHLGETSDSWCFSLLVFFTQKEGDEQTHKDLGRWDAGRSVASRICKTQGPKVYNVHLTPRSQDKSSKLETSLSMLMYMGISAT